MLGMFPGFVQASQRFGVINNKAATSTANHGTAPGLCRPDLIFFKTYFVLLGKSPSQMYKTPRLTEFIVAAFELM
jgi:hypothetical protein